MMLLLLMAAQAAATGPITPGAVPAAPSAGTIKCKLTSDDGQTANVAGEIVPPEPRMASQIHFTSDANKNFEGKYFGKWGPHGGDFAKVSGPVRTGVHLNLVTPTYISQHSSGGSAVAAKVASFGAGASETYAFYSGFCTFTNPKPFGQAERP